MNSLKEIKIRYFDKHGLETTSKKAIETRVSVYFDYAADSHHIQFPSNVDRRKIAILFSDLSRLITT